MNNGKSLNISLVLLIIFTILFYSLLFYSLGHTEDNVIEVIAKNIESPKKTIETKISAEKLNEPHGQNISKTLSTLPGVETESDSIHSKNSSIFLRGNPAGYVLVLYDGVELNDPMDPGNRRYDFSFFNSSGVEKIDVIHGPNNVKHGPQATGGVIDISTISENFSKKTETTAGYGSFNSVFANISNNSNPFLDIKNKISLNHSSSDGTSLFRGGETDGYKQYAISDTLSKSIGDSSNLTLTTRYSKNRYELDDFYKDDDNSISTNEKYLIGQTLTSYFNDGDTKTKLSFSHSTIKRSYVDEADNELENISSNFFHANKNEVKAQLEATLPNFLNIDSGVGHLVEEGKTDSYSMTRNNLSNSYAYMIANKEFNKTNISIGTRGSYNLTSKEIKYPINTKVTKHLFDDKLDATAEYATGYKYPSLIQLYSQYGEPTLREESSQSLAFSISSKTSKITIYQTLLANMIEYNLSAQKYYNNSKVKIRGGEFSQQLHLNNNLHLNISYSLNDCKNLTTHQGLPLRPLHTGKLGVDYSLKKLTFWCNVKTTSAQMSSDYPTGEKLGSNTKIDLGTSYKQNSTQYFFDIYNITNKKVAIYKEQGAIGISLFSGIKIDL